MPPKNFYILLGVNKNARADDLKLAYRNLAKKYHPDKNPDNKQAEEFFKEIQQAYDTLSDPEKRKAYDLKLTYGTSGGFNSTQRTQQQSNASYTGNAYQYAQQQAQRKQQPFNNIKQRPKKKDKPETYQIIISIAVAFILLYFIISYSSNKKSRATTLPSNKRQQIDSIQILSR